MNNDEFDDGKEGYLLLRVVSSGPSISVCSWSVATEKFRDQQQLDNHS